MNATHSQISSFFPPYHGLEGFALTSWSWVLACVISFLAIGPFLAWNGKKLKCLDMDGVPMKEIRVSPKAAALFTTQISKHGEKLAHDEPYILRDGNYCEVVIHTAEHVREFLRNDSKDHFRPASLGFGDYFYRVLGKCMGATSGERWRVIRTYFDPAYTHSAALAMHSQFQSEVSRWLNTMKSDTLRSGVGRLVVHAPTSCKALTLRVIPQSFYGEAYEDEAYAKLDRIRKVHAQILKNATTGRWQKYAWYNTLPTPSRRQLDEYHRDWHTFNLGILEDARNKKLIIPAEHVFKGVQPNNVISMEQYLQTIDEMIFTNIEITGSILAFILAKLAEHQHYQQRLYEEIEAEKSQQGFQMQNYLTCQTSLLHYLVLESIRLRPATWFSVPECITIDKVIGRYKIPAKTPVVIDVRRLNTSAVTWGLDSQDFRPERFSTMSPNEYRYGFMRFGVVSGKCLGKHMAEIFMKLAVITVLEGHRVENVEMNIGVKDGDLAFISRSWQPKKVLYEIEVSRARIANEGPSRKGGTTPT